jgi:hypothetical protein
MEQSTGNSEWFDPPTEEVIQRYYELNQQLKEIEFELAGLKKRFHSFFDATVGRNNKGETSLGRYVLQRQIRESVHYHEEHTVRLLEELNLQDCIKIIKVPDEEKIYAAVTLGLIDATKLEPCKNRKVTQAIVVKKI